MRKSALGTERPNPNPNPNSNPSLNSRYKDAVESVIEYSDALGTVQTALVAEAEDHADTNQELSETQDELNKERENVEQLQAEISSVQASQDSGLLEQVENIAFIKDLQEQMCAMEQEILELRVREAERDQLDADKLVDTSDSHVEVAVAL